MSFSRVNALSQALDIAGTLTTSSTMTLANEPTGLGAELSGQTGAAASITTVVSGIATVTGLTGMTAQSIGNFLTVSGAASAGNNGTFLIVTYLSATSVEISNASAVASDGNNGSISWTERLPYSLESDLNYARTDREAIKGVAYSAAIPTYQRPTAVGTNVPANLSNIAGKTTDAKALVVNRKFAGATVAASDGYVLISSAGNLKHADAIDRTGVPIQDGADAGADEATYVEIIDPTTEAALEVLTGPDAGKRIYGRTRAGSFSTSPNSVEVEFRAVANGSSLGTSVAYTWEAGQPTTVDLYYGYRERLDNLNETALRTVLTNGIVGDADLSQDIIDIRTTMGISDGYTSLSGLLTNTGNYFVFSDLPDATPSVVEALNTINEQIGDRNYSGAILSDGYTITESLQALANAVSGASFVRIIERLGSNITAGTAHTLPGGASYTVDNTNNGQNLVLYTRGVLRDPGPLVDGNDYEETSTTQVTFYALQRAGDHINYLIYS